MAKGFKGTSNPTHGNASTYRNSRYACRCLACRRAHTKAHSDERARRTERLKEDPSLAPHGRASTYINWGCRCLDCTRVHSAKCQRYARLRQKAQKARAAA